MKKLLIFQILISIYSLTSCDPIHTDGLQVINETKDSLYYKISTYKDIDSTYNMAYKVFAVGTNDNNQIKYKFVLDYENNDYAIKPNEIKKPYMVRFTWKNFAKKYKGLTFLFYRRETLEKMKPLVPLTEEKIFKRIDLTYEELEKNNYIVRLK